MSFSWSNIVRGTALAGLLLAVEPVHAEYLRIQLRVYGLDCELCARGVSASIQRMPGVKSVDVSLKKGLLEIVLLPGNTFKMSDLRKRIRENGFRSMEATVTAVGEFNGSKFEVLGSGESYNVSSPDPKAPVPVELTFDVH
ncbi:MAG TPA: heavy metal-associated domain-containing protein [Candidatus Acidoferrum sp.]